MDIFGKGSINEAPEGKKEGWKGRREEGRAGGVRDRGEELGGKGIMIRQGPNRDSGDAREGEAFQ